jgi:H+-transporting ATPase
MEIEDVFRLLQCDDNGLSSKEAQRRLGLFGPNKLESKERNAFPQASRVPSGHKGYTTYQLYFTQFLSFIWDPLSWVINAAAVFAVVLDGEQSTHDWQNFVSPRNTIMALKDSLAPRSMAKRDGKWSEIESAGLVPGDIICFKCGDIIPADCRLTDAINVAIDQAALTGEPQPQSKTLGDQCFS